MYFSVHWLLSFRGLTDRVVFFDELPLSVCVCVCQCELTTLPKSVKYYKITRSLTNKYTNADVGQQKIKNISSLNKILAPVTILIASE
jgi:hypothetical protein